MVESPHHIASRQDLSLELRQATQHDHVTLNAAIIRRLPLCLPPHAESPFQYAAGMVVFSQMYTAMEQAWDCSLESKGGDSHTSLDERQRHMLSTLKARYLRRSERLHGDIINLKRSLGPHAAHILDRLHDNSRFFHDSIRVAIITQPHLMLAYSWTMYLALFNGGRFIVKQLLRPGSTFWFGEMDTERIIEKHLSFWYFDDTPKDDAHGTQVKDDFKTRFSTVSQMLTDDERLQVIAECHAIFAQCASMIDYLDLEMERVQDGQLQTTCAEQAADGVGFEKASYISSIPPLAGIWQNLRSAINYATNATSNTVKV